MGVPACFNPSSPDLILAAAWFEFSPPQGARLNTRQAQSAMRRDPEPSLQVHDVAQPDKQRFVIDRDCRRPPGRCHITHRQQGDELIAIQKF